MYAVIVVTGPGQSGKTGLCKNSILGYYDINLENPGTSEQLLTAPKPFLAQHTEELITDEAQYLPELFSYIQVIVDENAEAKFVPA